MKYLSYITVACGIFFLVSHVALDPTWANFLKRRSNADGSGLHLAIYQQYHNKKAWSHMKPENDDLWRGLCQSRDKKREGSADVDAVELLPILNDQYYQDLTCEYGGFFALDLNLDTLHSRPWIGFQSWRAYDKAFGLSSFAIRQIVSATEVEAQGKNVIYYWAAAGPGGSSERNGHFYDACNEVHQNNCSNVYSRVFNWLFDTPRGEGIPPPMPWDNDYWAYMSYFVTSRDIFHEYITFARKFFVALDGLYYKEHHEQNVCPLGHGCGQCPPEIPPNYEYLHCWCYVMERLINIWAYQTQRRMFFVNPATGQMAEHHPIEKRDIWFDVFSPSSLKNFSDHFPERLQKLPHGAKLFSAIGGVL